MFNISLRNNILLGKDIPVDRLAKILDLVAASDFAKNLDAIVGSPDFNLSAGQQQRIRLARGLIQDGSLLLMDEPFNGIDEDTKVQIITKLRTYLNDKTVVLVTHNEGELKLINSVYRFNAGVLRADDL